MYFSYLQVAEAVATSSDSLGALSSHRMEVEGEMEYGLSAMMQGLEEDEEGEQSEEGMPAGGEGHGEAHDQDEDVDAEEGEEEEEEEEGEEVQPKGVHSCVTAKAKLNWMSCLCCPFQSRFMTAAVGTCPPFRSSECQEGIQGRQGRGRIPFLASAST